MHECMRPCSARPGRRSLQSNPHWGDVKSLKELRPGPSWSSSVDGSELQVRVVFLMKVWSPEPHENGSIQARCIEMPGPLRTELGSKVL